MSMRTVAIGSSGGLTLRGVVHEPAGRVQNGEAAILLPGLAGTRVGPHRILFDLAARLAGDGAAVLRCDLTGTGYSDGPPATLARFVEDTRDMMRFMEAEFGTERFLLGGICRGAKVALATALGDPRIQRLILLTCPRLREASIVAKSARRRLHHMKQYLEKALNLKWVPRLLSGDLNLSMIGEALLSPVDLNRLERVNAEEGSFDLQRLAARALFIYGERDPDLGDHCAYYRQVFADRAGRVAFRIIEESDQAFYAVRWRQAALEAADQWSREPVR